MGDVIAGRYELLELLARGGAGSVWRARDLRTNEVCAAKLLRQRDSADLLRFVRETGIALDHPHIVAPTGWAAEDAHVVIGMPLVLGGTVDQLLRRRGPLGDRAVAVLLDQLMSALEAVHAGGWVHRDVKPGNLLLEPTAPGALHVRLGDFGIAVHRTDVRLTHVGMINGTPGYMAPELFRLADPAPTHDVYSAGVCALVALDPEFRPADGPIPPPELARALRRASRPLSTVVRRMVEAEPARRYADATAVRAALRPLLGGRGAGPLTHADRRPLVVEPQGGTVPSGEVADPAPAHGSDRAASAGDRVPAAGPAVAIDPGAPGGPAPAADPVPTVAPGPATDRAPAGDAVRAVPPGADLAPFRIGGAAAEPPRRARRTTWYALAVGAGVLGGGAAGIGIGRAILAALGALG